MGRLSIGFVGIIPCLSGTTVMAQRSETPIYPIRLPQGFVMEGLSGYGSANSTMGTASEIGSCNPALLSDFLWPSIGASEQFETKIYPAWYAGIGFKRGRPFIPQSAGIVVPFGRWRFGTGFSRRYNSFMDSGEMSVTTADTPEGTGEKISAWDETHIQSYSLLSGVTLPSWEQGKMNIGGRFSIDRMSYISKVWKARAQAVDYAVSWSAGFRYDIQVDSVYLKLGMFFEKGPRFRTHASYTGMDLLQPVDVDPYQVGGNNIPIRIQPHEWPVIANLPSRLHAGIFLGSVQRAFITLDYTQFSMGQAIELFRDCKQVAGNAGFRVIQFMLVTVGFLSSETHTVYGDSYPLVFLNPPSALYYAAGCVCSVTNFELDLALATSKNTDTSPWYRQTILKLGINYHL